MSTLLSKVVLLEGITHIEDLPAKEFIRTVESLRDKIVTEKLDGANLWFGLDDTGFFTSREGKSPKKGRFYNVDDYAMVANYNAFRAAHLALERVEPTIRKYLKPGDMVEIEVLFGRQPNTVTYGVEGKSFIVILRGVNGTPQDRVDALSQGLNHKKVTVESTIVSSPDGTEIEMNDQKLTWEFTNVEPMQGKAIDTKDAMALLAKMKHFIAQKNEDFPELTNQEVAELSLTSVDKTRKDAAKQERERVNAYIMNEFKSPIKELLLNNFVRKIKPMLSDKKLHPSEDIGVEGVVVRDPVTGSMTKIVDKDVFTAINTFNSAVRANISGLVRTTDQDAAVEMRGGAFGQAKIRIAELIGAKELALSSGTKRWLAKFKKTDAPATALAAANSLNIKSVPSVRTKIAAILNETLKEVDSILHSFKQEAGEFKLKLKTGKEIGITPEVMKRTLTAFAETKKDIAEVAANVMKSRTAADIVMALYGKQIEALFDGGDSVKESYSILKSITEDDGGAGAAAPGGAAPGAGAGTSAASVGTTSSNVATTKAGNIAPYPFKLAGGKMVMRRKRGFVKPKKFPAPGVSSTSFEPIGAKMGVPESKFSLIKSMNENWAHVSDMKFAADVDDKATRSGDVEFNQLRNNVNVGDQDVTAMDVDRYLDKAHEINDEVDSVIFGMELDDGQVVKVYVNAGQADDFENALGQMLGKEDDVERVINDLANKFDIVDVEWPSTMQAPQPGEETLPSPEGEVVAPVDDMSNPDMNLDIEPHHEEGGEEGGMNLDIESHHEEGGEEEAPASDEGEEGGEEEAPASDEGEEEEGGEERNEFGEVVGKKKKKKKKEETEEEPTEESAIPKGPVLSEAQASHDALMNLLQLLGFDLDANRSINNQASRQEVKTPLQKFNAQPSQVSKLGQVISALTSTLKGANVTPGTKASTTPPSSAAPQVTAGYSLMGSIIAEEGPDAVEGKWIIGKMGEHGLLLKAKGLTIRINDEEATKLAVGLDSKRVVSVASGDKRFIFTPSEGGSFLVKEKDSEEFKDGLVMSPEQVQDVLDIIETE